MIKLLSKLLLIIFILLISPLLKGSSINAQSPTQYQPLIIELGNVQNGNGKLNGTLSVNNPNDSAFRNVYYTVRLTSPSTTQIENHNGTQSTIIVPGSMVSSLTSNKFELKSKTQNINMSLDYGPSLVAGDYNMQIAFFSESDLLLGAKTTTVSLNGNGTNITVNRCFLVVDNIEYEAAIGPNVAPKQEFHAKCNVTNPSSPQTVYPTVEYAVNSVLRGEGKQVADSKNAITIPSGVGNIIIPLPPLDTPQVYEGLVTLKDGSGNPVSDKITLRWTISGASAQIRSISTDKTTYKKGESAKVTIGADPSLDLFWKGGGPTQSYKEMPASLSAKFAPNKDQGTPLKNPTISVVLKDQYGAICGSLDYKVGADPNDNTWPDQILNVPMQKDCENVVVEANVKDDGKVLATKTLDMNLLKKVDVKDKITRNPLLVILAILGILTIIGAVFWFIKKRKKNLPPPLKSSTTIAAFLLTFTLFSWLAFSFAAPALANQAIRIGTDEITATNPANQCPGPVWLPTNPQPTDNNRPGGACLLGMVSGSNWTTFTALDTQNEMTFGADKMVHAHVSGQFTGSGCGNDREGLVIRAFVNGSQSGVTMSSSHPRRTGGSGARLEYTNLASNGGGSGTPFDDNLTITSTINKCGPLDVRIEIIPFFDHVGRIASDRAEDRLITEAEVPGWHNIEYHNRSNCGGGGNCWATIQKTVDAGNCRQCNDPCTTQTDCNGVQNGCTVCRPSETTGLATQMTCQPGKQCNAPCNTPADCVGAQNGCSQCLPIIGGTGSSCQPPPACGVACVTPADCNGAQNGCTNCLPNATGTGRSCQTTPSCGNACITPADCNGAQNGCTNCLPNLNGNGNSCQKTPACGTPCLNQTSCVGAEGGCVNCIRDASGTKCGSCPSGMNYDPTAQKCVCPNPGETNPHGVCDGDKCANVNTCGVTECTTDKQCFAEEMCKCDGFDAVTLEYPSAKPFTFDAFAKIEGLDISKAIVEGIQFKMSESDKSNPNSGSIIAQSPMYTPEIVSSTAQKVRFKATWNLTPPVIKANKMYRVFADIKCKPKTTRRLTDASNPKQYQSAVMGVSTANAAESSTPITAKDDLQLKTLNMIKKGQTDNCRFLFFEFDAGLQ